MKIIQINATSEKGSTGGICVAVSRKLNEIGIENYVLYNNGKSNYPQSVKYCSDFSVRCCSLISRIVGNWGFENIIATHNLIHILNTVHPDIIHLHNMHSHGGNIQKILEWASRNRVKVVWTFHDCWALTGYCMHYDMIRCDKWRDVCGRCPQYRTYSFILDRSGELQRKKAAVIKQADTVITTPSEWMADQVRCSMVKDVPVRVIRNGIDLTDFNRIESDFREKYNLYDKKIILGVARWSHKKGIDVFVHLSRMLDVSYRIVLVGTTDKTDSELPADILSLHSITDKKELAKIYSAADVFVNPTREEVLGLTNIEALACGTPVVTFRTGGSPECIDETCGYVVEKDDIHDLLSKIEYVCKIRPFRHEDCIRRAACFSVEQMQAQYIKLYEDLLS